MLSTVGLTCYVFSCQTTVKSSHSLISMVSAISMTFPAFTASFDFKSLLYKAHLRLTIL